MVLPSRNRWEGSWNQICVILRVELRLKRLPPSVQ